MSTNSRPPRKILPVDVLEDDKLYTRGYVQDVLDDGRCLVYFDCVDDPLRAVDAARIFIPRHLPKKPRGIRMLRDSSVGSFAGDWEIEKDDFDYDSAESLGPKEVVEVLVRSSPDASARWYTAVVISSDSSDEEIVIDITNGPGGPRKGVLNKPSRRSTAQRPKPRKLDEVTVVHMRIPASLRSVLESKDFAAEWEKKWDVLVQSVDLERSMVTVVVGENHPLSPVRSLKRMLATRKTDTTSTVKTGPATRKRTDGYHRMETRETKKRKVKESNVPAVSWNPLLIPELLAGIFRHLSLSDRHILRTVSSLWRAVMESSLVSRSLHFDDSKPRRDYQETMSFVD